jgi:hypothetical protein
MEELSLVFSPLSKSETWVTRLLAENNVSALTLKHYSV